MKTRTMKRRATRGVFAHRSNAGKNQQWRSLCSLPDSLYFLSQHNTLTAALRAACDVHNANVARLLLLRRRRPMTCALVRGCAAAADASLVRLDAQLGAEFAAAQAAAAEAAASITSITSSTSSCATSIDELTCEHDARRATAAVASDCMLRAHAERRGVDT